MKGYILKPEKLVVQGIQFSFIKGECQNLHRKLQFLTHHKQPANTLQQHHIKIFMFTTVNEAILE